MTMRIEPNPVPRSAGPATVRVTWDSGDTAGGELRVARDGGTEAVFASGPRGTVQATWIRPGSTYEFRLYRPRQREPIASQTVYMERTAGVVSQFSARAGKPHIIATPNPLPIGARRGTTRLSWATGDGSGGIVTVTTRGRATRDQEAPVASGHAGEKEIDWITRDVTYRFRLYRSANDRKPIAETRVTMGFERREVLADIAVLAAVVVVPATVVLVAGVLMRRAARTVSGLVRREQWA